MLSLGWVPPLSSINNVTYRAQWVPPIDSQAVGGWGLKVQRPPVSDISLAPLSLLPCWHTERLERDPLAAGREWNGT